LKPLHLNQTRQYKVGDNKSKEKEYEYEYGYKEGYKAVRMGKDKGGAFPEGKGGEKHGVKVKKKHWKEKNENGLRGNHHSPTGQQQHQAQPSASELESNIASITPISQDSYSLLTVSLFNGTNSSDEKTSHSGSSLERQRGTKNMQHGRYNSVRNHQPPANHTNKCRP